MSIAYLRVKIKSLSAESRIIRHAERRWKPRWQKHQDTTFFGLRGHRTGEVRSEARSALLAYAYLRGRSYGTVEAKTYEAPDLERIASIVSKFGPGKVTNETLKQWAEPGPIKHGPRVRRMRPSNHPPQGIGVAPA